VKMDSLPANTKNIGNRPVHSNQNVISPFLGG